MPSSLKWITICSLRRRMTTRPAEPGLVNLNPKKQTCFYMFRTFQFELLTDHSKMNVSDKIFVKTLG